MSKEIIRAGLIGVNTRAMGVLLLLGLPLLASSESPAWWVEHNAGLCLLRSPLHKASDGYDETSYQLLVSVAHIEVRTRSDLDSTYKNTGISVDEQARIAYDRTEGASTAVFESQYLELIEQFKAGYIADVALGFWPTWPQVELTHVEFDLRGFTAAYTEFLDCVAGKSVTEN